MWTIVLKEFRELLYNPRFLFSAIVAAILILTSIYNGYSIYQSELENAIASEAYALQEAEKTETYQFIELDVVRRPNVLSIFDTGLSGVLGRQGNVETNDEHPAKVTDSRNEENPVFALFSELDLTKTVSIVLALFAILFAHSMITAEREDGTLKLIIANSVSRSSILSGKIIGGFVPLALLLIIPALAGFLALTSFGSIAFSWNDWFAITLMVLGFLLYLLVFYLLGLAMSALSRSSFISLMFCLLFWVLSVAILPRVAVYAANASSPPVSLFEMEKKLQTVRNNYSKEWAKKLSDSVNSKNLTRKQWGENFRDILNTVRKEMSQLQMERNRKIYEEYYRKRQRLLNTVETYSRISPTASLNHIIHRLAGSGPDMLPGFEEDLERYVDALTAYSKAKYEEFYEEEKNKSHGAVGLQLDDDENGFVTLKSVTGYDQTRVDLSDMPNFRLSETSIDSAVNKSLTDFTVLAFFSILFLTLAYTAFIRYDVR